MRSKQRVTEFGEVFTPAWLVEDMLDLVEHESDRIDSRFLESACGSGNFLIPVLRRKLSTVHGKYRRSEFEKRHNALHALMCTYGIELLADNVAECRQNLLDTLFEYLGAGSPDEWFAAARVVVDANIIHGDALSMTTASGQPIVFAEWGYLGRGRFQRRDFRFEQLTKRSMTGGELPGMATPHDIFTPVQTFPAMTVTGLGA